MRNILSCAAMAVMIALAWNANGTLAAQEKTPAKKTSPKKKGSPAKKSGVSSSGKKGAGTVKKGTSTASARTPGTTTRSASSRGKKTPAKRVTWRNRQMTPSPDRYREIQGALASKGFLNPEDATGTWNQASSDALKRFQAEQNLESSGKINSLSLIALGLGPKRETASAPPPKPPPPPPPGQ
jgi:Putative peptidoglycan binding domain